jgi:hypothetical protein
MLSTVTRKDLLFVDTLWGLHYYSNSDLQKILLASLYWAVLV